MAHSDDDHHASAEFSEDGSTVAFGSQHPELRSGVDLTLLKSFPGGHGWTRFVMAPTGGHIAMGSSDRDDSLTVFVGGDPAVRTIRHVRHEIVSGGLAWSADAKWLFVISNAGNDKIKWNVVPAIGHPKCNGREITYLGTAGPDVVADYGVIMSGAGDDTIKITSGEGTVCAGEGNDAITGWFLSDWLHGGPGDDTIIGRDGQDEMLGGTGSDTVSLQGKMNATVNLATGVINRGHETDTIMSIENVIGSNGADTIIGDSGPNVLVGRKGRDVIDGGGGADTLDGGKANDVLMGGTGPDSLFGDTGRDLLAGEGSDDTIDGGAGIDTVSFANATKKMTIDLGAGTATGQGDDTLANVEWVIGSPQRDTIVGDGSSNYIDGGLAGDDISGKGGDDYLVGGKGTDTLAGGSGTDSCVGGETTSSCETTIAFALRVVSSFNPAAYVLRAAELFRGML